jgi:hypothetical protein
MFVKSWLLLASLRDIGCSVDGIEKPEQPFSRKVAKPAKKKLLQHRFTRVMFVKSWLLLSILASLRDIGCSVDGTEKPEQPFSRKVAKPAKKKLIQHHFYNSNLARAG